MLPQRLFGIKNTEQALFICTDCLSRNSKCPMAYSNTKQVGFLLGPLLFTALLCFPEEFINPTAHRVIAVACWMICWWVTEAVSISVTALLPLAIFPMLGVMNIDSVASNYANPIVFLFLGGFVIALALEKVQLHRRIALTILSWTGTNADGIVLGFMLATALLSMWISNTASTVVMLPIALSVIGLLLRDQSGFSKGEQNFALSIMLGIAFAANIGGTATLIGTPPNTVMAGIVSDQFGIEISFLRWFLLGFPFAAVLLLITYLVVVKWMYPNGLGRLESSETIIQEELHKLGPIRKEEQQVLAIFLLTAFLWIARSQLNSWLPWLNLSDAGISMLGAFLLFTTPKQLRQGQFLLDWEDTARLPWGILILFGGGLALAQGLSDSGIIDLIGDSVAAQQGWSLIAVTSVLICIMLFMTELMSNVALSSIFTPVVAGIALGLDAEVLHLTIPVALASSCAFMLPMATPPNAIVFASGHIRVYQMVRVGIILNLISVLLLIVLAFSFVKWIF